jgi:hypothetical protein
MIVFKFKTKEEFDKAAEVLKKAIDAMASPHFDHAVQPAEKTISVIQDKSAEIIEGLLKKNSIKDYEKEEDLSWAHPVCVASVIRQAAFRIRLAGLISHAKFELERAGITDDKPYEAMIAKDILDLCDVFSKQGHTGFSAKVTLDLFNRLANFRTLSPITSDPSEWEDTSKYGSGKNPKMWQNKRNPAIFSSDGGKTWYDVDDPKKVMKSQAPKKAGFYDVQDLIKKLIK